MWSTRSIESIHSLFIYLTFSLSLSDEFRRKFHTLKVLFDQWKAIIYFTLGIFLLFFFLPFICSFIHSMSAQSKRIRSHLFIFGFHAIIFFSVCVFICFLFNFVWFAEQIITILECLDYTYWFLKFLNGVGVVNSSSQFQKFQQQEVTKWKY